MTELHRELPEGVEYVRTTDLFDEHNHPGGLLRAHQVAVGVWARLGVQAGALTFVFDDDPAHPLAVGAGDTVVIPPSRRHHLEFPGAVAFSLEFYREADTAPRPVGAESTGLQP